MGTAGNLPDYQFEFVRRMEQLVSQREVLVEIELLLCFLGDFLECFWSVLGKFLEYSWSVLGMFMEYSFIFQKSS
jgi:hypothetical protein